MKTLFILLIVLLVVSAISYRFCIDPYMSLEGEPITLRKFALGVDNYRQRHPRMPKWFMAYILGLRRSDLEAALNDAERIKEMEESEDSI